MSHDSTYPLVEVDGRRERPAEVPLDAEVVEVGGAEQIQHHRLLHRPDLHPRLGDGRERQRERDGEQAQERGLGRGRRAATGRGHHDGARTGAENGSCRESLCERGNTVVSAHVMKQQRCRPSLDRVQARRKSLLFGRSFFPCPNGCC